MPILNNFPLVAAVVAISISQLTKIPVAYLINRRFDSDLIFSTGGMPSSHSAGVTALITAIILDHGWQSPFTAISMIFGILVMFDSMGVRRQSGEHGIIINVLISEFQELTRSLTTSEAEIENLETESKTNSMQSTEFLGHKPIEVFFGGLYGIILALIVHSIFYA